MENAGYTIIKRDVYDVVNRYGVALAFNGEMFVTWDFILDETYDTTDTMYDESKTSYLWGHYISDPLKAEADYHKRLYDRLIELSEVKNNDRK